MYVLGHLGFTAAAVRLADRRRPLVLPLALALLPDVVDKPVRLLLPGLVNRNTRGFGHTLAGAALVLALLWAVRRRVERPVLLWLCYLGHFVLDRMWLHSDPRVLLWPALG